jgi:dihydroorotase
MTGLETALPIVNELMVQTGLMSWEDVARVLSVTPAMIGRVWDQGRPLAAGEPANITVFDPDATWVADPKTMETASSNTPVAGRTMRGRTVATFLHGTPTVLDGEVVK